MITRLRTAPRQISLEVNDQTIAPQLDPVTYAARRVDHVVMPDDFVHRVRGNLHAKIMVVCDPPSRQAADAGLPNSMDNLVLFGRSAGAEGFTRDDFCFVSLCPPLPDHALDSAARKWAHVEKHRSSLLQLVAQGNPRCVVTMGDLATRCIAGRAQAITKVRGQPQIADGRPYFPMLSPGFVRRVPEHEPTFKSDFATLKRFHDDSFIVRESNAGARYEWREDISDILAMDLDLIAVDTETTGLRWYDPKVRVLTVQIATKPGEGFVCPVDVEFWPEWNGRLRARSRLISQLKQLLEDPRIRKVGHNLKFDAHMLRKSPLSIEIAGWTDDTNMMAFAIDENMMEKSQEECVLRWAPELAAVKGSITDAEKADMLHLPRERFLPYAGSDPDGVLRLYYKLAPMLGLDQPQSRCYQRIMMPGLKAFADTVERIGMLVDRDGLRSFGVEVRAHIGEEYKWLISHTPPKVRLKHIEAGKELKFSRADFVRDILFTPDGFGLTPIVFTKSTQRLADHEKIASTSAKDHMPFFTEREDAAGEFVLRLIEYQKAQKLETTYIGSEQEQTGIWQYISHNGRIYPSYSLSTTNTGRTSSRDPNGQNFPKRGRWAKPYQKIFKATPGYKLINCDLSQIELRIAAWMANEPRMLEIYRSGGDIHAATAQAVAGLIDAQWAALDPKERKLLRFKAKAINFGFLYGMGANKFRNFAKTDYGVTYTEQEAYRTRERFFTTYAALPNWHMRMREEVKRNKQVRALHGSLRRLPSIDSSEEGTSSGAERQAINAPVQRFGSDLGLMAMIRYCAQADPEYFRITGFVHDALMMEVKEGYEREGLSSLLWVMNNAPLERWFGITPPLPLIAEGDIGINGGEMLELADLPPVDKRPQWFTDMGWDTAPPEKPSWWDDGIESDEDRLVERAMQRMHITLD